LLTLALLYGLVKRLYDRELAVLSVTVLMSTGLFFVISGSVMTDPALTAMTTLIMVAFARVMTGADVKPPRRWQFLFFTGLGLSILAKGPVAWILTGVPIAAWTIMRGQVREAWRRFPWFAGLLWTLLLAVPWHLLAERETPGFLDYYFIGEHWKRFTVSDWKGDLYGSAHEKAKGMIWLFAVVGTLPWSLFAVTVWRRAWSRRSAAAVLRDPARLFLWLWFLTPMVFFTAAGNISLYYVLPGLPGFAVLTALGLRQWQKHFSRPLRAGLILIAVMVAVPVVFAAASVTVMPRFAGSHSQKAAAAAFKKHARTPQARLVYVQPLPDSADFYSRGRAESLRSVTDENIRQILADDREDFFVIERDHVNFTIWEIHFKSYQIGRSGDFGDFILLRECGHDPQHVLVKERCLVSLE